MDPWNSQNKNSEETEDVEKSPSQICRPEPSSGVEKDTMDPLDPKLTKSPGVARLEAINSCTNNFERFMIFFGIFIIGYVYGLDSSSYMQTYALSSFGENALQASVNIVSSVVSAAVLPTAGKISDVFGRLEVVILAVFFYILGRIIQAAARNTSTFAGGSVLNTIGLSIFQVIFETMIADVTSTRSRVLFSYIPALPFIINIWISGNVVSAIVGENGESASDWRWGIGMWCIIMFVFSLPLICTLAWVKHKASKRGLLKGHPSVYKYHKGVGKFLVALFWELDVVGIIFVIAVFILILVPLTIAGGVQSEWKKAKIIAPLVVGICCIPAWIYWELWAPKPMIPFRKMGKRYIWAPFGIACFLDFCYYLQSDYLYQVLIVSFNFDTLWATRVSGFYSFVSVIIGVITGVAIYYTRRMKIYMLLGSAMFLLAYGLLIYFRGGESGKAGVIAGEVILGLGGGMFPYQAQACIQAFVEHEYVAVMTGLFLALYKVGAAFGQCVQGSEWTQLVPGELQRQYERAGNASLAALAYQSPYTVIAEYPEMNDPMRIPLVESYRYIQRIMCITGICLVVPIVIFVIVLPNPILTSERSLVEDDEDVLQHKPKGFWGKLEKALSATPPKKLELENRSRWKKLLNQLW